jgi:hypothetical protein
MSVALLLTFVTSHTTQRLSSAEVAIHVYDTGRRALRFTRRGVGSISIRVSLTAQLLAYSRGP